MESPLVVFATLEYACFAKQNWQKNKWFSHVTFSCTWNKMTANWYLYNTSAWQMNNLWSRWLEQLKDYGEGSCESSLLGHGFRIHLSIRRVVLEYKGGYHFIFFQRGGLQRCQKRAGIVVGIVGFHGNFNHATHRGRDISSIVDESRNWSPVFMRAIRHRSGCRTIPGKSCFYSEPQPMKSIDCATYSWPPNVLACSRKNILHFWFGEERGNVAHPLLPFAVRALVKYPVNVTCTVTVLVFTECWTDTAYSKFALRMSKGDKSRPPPDFPAMAIYSDRGRKVQALLCMSDSHR